MITEAQLNSKTFVKSDSPGVIEEAAFDEENDEEIKNAGYSVATQENKAINGFLDIRLAWEQNEIEQNIKLFFRGTSAYAFLPSYADVDGITIKYDESNYTLSVDGESIGSAASLAGFKVNWDYKLEIIYRSSKEESDEYGDAA